MIGQCSCGQRLAAPLGFNFILIALRSNVKIKAGIKTMVIQKKNSVKPFPHMQMIYKVYTFGISLNSIQDKKFVTTHLQLPPFQHQLCGPSLKRLLSM